MGSKISRKRKKRNKEKLPLFYIFPLVVQYVCDKENLCLESENPPFLGGALLVEYVCVAPTTAGAVVSSFPPSLR